MESDRDTLYQIHRSAMRSYVDAVWGWDEEDQQQRFRTYVNGGGLQAIVVGSEVIGFLHVKRSDQEIRVVNIEVTPAHQGQGIGSTIPGTLLGEGKKEMIPVTLKVLKVNERAYRLYQRLGFVSAGETPTHHLLRYPVQTGESLTA